jgi:hypothetical protein
MENGTPIIEVNGIKMEVDLRHSKVIHQNIRVGTKVKILAKGAYGGPEVYPAVVVGFEPFTDLPTIIVAYVKAGYASADLQFAYVNSKSADKWDLVPSVDDELPINKADVLAVFERDITKKRNEISDMESKRDFFLKHFDKYFVPAEATV